LPTEPSTAVVDPSEVFSGGILMAIPHMDDGVLACGGTIAGLTQKERVHLVYATDGMGSPAPVVPGRDAVSPDLGRVRKEEARAAMGYLGIPDENFHFLDLPDGGLHRHTGALTKALTELIGELRPSHVFIPFRYDRHSDHLALNRAVTRALRAGVFSADLVEYFVYYRWRLLPRGDVRAYIDPRHLLTVPIEVVADRKREALERFRSQTTKYYSWQTRPNLMPALLDEVSRSPEIFLRYEPSFSGAEIFLGTRTWIRVAHRLEPFLKVHKDRAVALWRRALPADD
jgi:LmbE family N-acetylglucosaminyl deacetylase